MKNPAVIFIGVALMLGAAAIVWQPLMTLIAVDSCLDTGGSFDYTAGTCDFERSHPLPAENNTAGLAAAAALAAGGIAVTITGRYVRRKPRQRML